MTDVVQGGTEMDVLFRVREQYAEEGLRVPPVPRSLAGQMREQGSWEWGTEAMDLTNRQSFIARAFDPATPDSVGLGYVGYGTSSWFMCYQLVFGALAVFVKVPYGGAYDDADSDALNRTFDQLDELIVGVLQLGAAAPEDGRLLVVLDDLEGSMWGGSDGEPEPTDSKSPILDALAFLGG